MTHLKPGDKAPNFKATDQNDNPVNLDSFKGKKLVLYFYPKDNTPGCTVEACSFRDEYEDLLNAGFAVVGVSADTAKKHENFAKKYKLPFPLIPDTDKEIIRAYGVWGEKKFMGRTFDGIHRVTFVIGESGIIEHVVEKVKTKAAAKQIMELYG